mgnify:CR=1 FL=1
MSLGPLIRAANPQDLMDILAILNEWPKHFVGPARSMVTDDFNNHRTLIFENHGTVEGFLIWREIDGKIEALWLAVMPHCCNHGIGRSLMNALFAIALPEQEIFLLTATTDSVVPNTTFDGPAYAATIRFFLGLGFKEIATVPNYWGPGNHCLVMAKAPHGQAFSDPRSNVN